MVFFSLQSVPLFASLISGRIAELIEKLIIVFLETGSKESSSIKNFNASKPKNAKTPVIAQSTEELLSILKTWTSCHPGRNAPGALPSTLPTSDGCRQVKHKQKLTFIGSTGNVWVVEQAVDAEQMILILTEEDGYSMIVKAHADNTRCWQSYHAWLGDDNGFTKNSIASTDGLSWADIELTDSDHDDDETIEVFEFEDKGSKITHPTDKTKRQKPTTASNTKEHVETCKDPCSESEMTELTDFIPEREDSSKKDGLITPPLSCIDTVKRMHWPPQHPGTPPPTPQKESSAKILRGKAEKGQKLKKGHGSEAKQTAEKKRKNVTTILPDLPSTKRTKRSCNLPAEASSEVRTIVEPSTPVVFHISLMDTALGVISVDFNNITTFFDEVASAAAYLNRNQRNLTLEGVIADIEGEGSRLFLAWNDLGDYSRLCGAINKVTLGSDKQQVDVRIYCLRELEPDLHKLPAMKL